MAEVAGEYKRPTKLMSSECRERNLEQILEQIGQTRSGEEIDEAEKPFERRNTSEA